MKKFVGLFILIILFSGISSGCLKKEDIVSIIPSAKQQESLAEAEQKDKIAQEKADVSVKKMEKLSQKKETFEPVTYQQNDFQLAEKSYNEKNYTDAILGFNKIVKDDPKNYKAYCMLAMSYAQKGESVSAQNVLTGAIEKFPNEWNAYTIMGDILRSEHNYPLAIEYYKKALASPKITNDGKVRYLKLIEQTKKEQNIRNEKASKLGLITNSVEMNLDKDKWGVAYNAGNDKNWIVEYGLQGEDVQNYKWTQLVTVQFFEKDFYKKTPEEHILLQLGAIEKMAINTQKMFTKSVISNSPKDITYEWVFDKGSESEVARVVKTDKGLYHLHYAKKGIITSEERKNWVDVLKKAKIKE